jgi:7-cyano-7-deazaguanine synthase
MWVDKAQTFALANDIGGERLMRIVLRHAHSCYLATPRTGTTLGYGCGTCPACELQSRGWLRYSGKNS